MTMSWTPRGRMVMHGLRTSLLPFMRSKTRRGERGDHLDNALCWRNIYNGNPTNTTSFESRMSLSARILSQKVISCQYTHETCLFFIGFAWFNVTRQFLRCELCVRVNGTIIWCSTTQIYVHVIQTRLRTLRFARGDYYQAAQVKNTSSQDKAYKKSSKSRHHADSASTSVTAEFTRPT